MSWHDLVGIGSLFLVVGMFVKNRVYKTIAFTSSSLSLLIAYVDAFTSGVHDAVQSLISLISIITVLFALAIVNGLVLCLCYIKTSKRKKCEKLGLV